MVCRCTRTPRPGRCMDSTHRSSHLTPLPSSFRSVRRCPRQLRFRAASFVLVSFLFCFLLPLPRFHAVSSCCPVPLRFAACAFPGVRAGMTGSDSEEAGHVSPAELATFRQNMENEMAQLQAALHRAVNDLADTTRSPAPVGGGGSNDGPGPQPGSPAAGAPLPGHGAPSIALGPDRNQAAPQPGRRCRVTAPPASPCSALSLIHI